MNALVIICLSCCIISTDSLRSININNSIKGKINNDSSFTMNSLKSLNDDESSSSDKTKTGKHLEPDDWELFRRQLHELVDVSVDRLMNAGDHPWQPVPDSIKESYSLDKPLQTSITDALVDTVLPYHTGNTHPRFFGWVHGTGVASGLMSELLSATMNSNCGGRDHGMVYIERAVIAWAKSIFGFPTEGSGVLVTGTSQATVIALSAARLRKLGADVRKTGNQNAKLVLYSGAGVHSALRKAVELLGIGTDNLRLVPLKDAARGIDLDALEEMIEADLKEGMLPFAVVGTAGSVDIGRFDDLNGLADVADKYDLWLHIDGAFGAWARISHDSTIKSLTDGIDRATSLACDFHKWMYMPYDCGMILIRNEADHRAAFAARPSYLAGQSAGVAGGDPWYCDYGIDLSRGARALRVWTALKTYGVDAFSKAITDNCYLARYMGDLISKSELLELAAPRVISNVVVFTARKDLSVEDQSALNKQIAVKLQLDGVGILSTTIVDGDRCVLRAAIANHRTTHKDIDVLIAAVQDAAQ